MRPQTDSEHLDSIFRVPFTFRARPAPLIATQRLSWRVPALLLMLHIGSRGGKSSLARLHVLQSAMKSDQAANSIGSAIRGDQLRQEIPRIDFDPSLPVVVLLAEAAGFVSRADATHVSLQAAGKAIASVLIDEPIFEREKLRMIRLKPLLTEKSLKLLSRREVLSWF